MTKPSVIDAMAATLSPETLADLLTLRDALGASSPKGGTRGALVQTFATAKGCSVQTAYRWLKENVGWSPERKLRTDAGKTRCPDDTLHFIASSVNASVRNNGVSTKLICVAMNIAQANGLEVNVSAARMATLMRSKRLDVKAQSTARNHQRLRSLHPNHVHQIDPSLCLVFYMGGKQYIMDAETFNKNKPTAMERIKLKVWRYVRYDHASGSLDVRYFEAAGENQASLFDFLLHTWGQCATRPSHGVPRLLLWDKGSANTSTGIKRLLDALGVNHITHAKAYKGALVPLAHPNPTVVVVSNEAASTTYVEGTDYEVRAGGIFILAAGSIVDAANLKVDYTYGAYAQIEAMTSTALILELHFEGLNEANSGKPVIVDVYRAQLSPAKALSLLGDKFSDLTIDAEVLIDPSKTGTGISKYFRVKLA
jgi:hypothetical protein